MHRLSLIALFLLLSPLISRAAEPTTQLTTHPTTRSSHAATRAALRLATRAATTQSSTQPTTRGLTWLGPDIVLLDQLEAMYEPVPFDHTGHAQMAEMWGGCTTCHHRSPLPTTLPVSALHGERKQELAARVPACKSCHPAAQETADDIHLPNLKGAYHRQCLNCHRDWMHGNACVICHEPKDGHTPQDNTPTADDIVGRMHPPMPEPEAKQYKVRFTPAMGGNVLFRHQEHTDQFGLRCVSCHHEENCSSCHDGQKEGSGPKPLKPGKTWADSHGPCAKCHQQDRCNHCHYKDGQQPPAAFSHNMTGQALDKDHNKLACVSCHANVKTRVTPTCGDQRCHHNGAIIYPQRRPGKVLTTQPATQPTTRSAVKVQTVGDMKRVRQ